MGRKPKKEELKRVKLSVTVGRDVKEYLTEVSEKTDVEVSRVFENIILEHMKREKRKESKRKEQEEERVLFENTLEGLLDE